MRPSPTPKPSSKSSSRPSSPTDRLQHAVSQLPTWLRLSDLQGLAQLATQGTLGVAGLAETVQGNVYKAVAAVFGPTGARFLDRTPGGSGVKKAGIAGLAYAGVRGVTRLAGGGVNALLAAGALRAGPPKTVSPEREAMLSAINGVLGDHLLASANPLAISMCLRHGGEPLTLEKPALAARLPGATGKLLVLVHGLCMNDLQWGSGAGSQHHHGELLARELGYTPVYLHYNSGLHTSANGQQFAALLEQLWQAWPQPIEELTVLAHSMGGLVSRSACHHGEQAGHPWRKGLKNLVFLGTPHHGAPLEGLGNWVDTLLGSNVVTRPFASIGQIRSAGITDLRHGNVLDADWHGTDRFKRAPDARQLLPLPAGVACFALAGTTLAAGSGALSSVKEALSHQVVGDGLVPLPSALGQHEQAARCLAFADDKVWIAPGVGHMALLKRPEVSRQLVQWLRP